jgi:hypothetical protein
MIGKGVRLGATINWPDSGEVDVSCRACGRDARFTSPYDYLHDEAAERARRDSRLRGVNWSNGFVVERFPDTFPWLDPNNPYTHMRSPQIWGVVSCGHCGCRKKHLLAWPADAYYRIDTPAGELWAYTLAHLVEIRKCIAGDRARRAAYDHGHPVHKLPKEFLLKRHRERVLRAVDELLLPRRKRAVRPAV